MNDEHEAYLWCPRCAQIRFELRRRPLGQPGHFEHVLIPQRANSKTCEVCSTNLERKS